MYLYLVERQLNATGDIVREWSLAGDDEAFLRSFRLKLGDRVMKVAADADGIGVAVGATFYVDSVEPVFKFSAVPVDLR